MNHTGYLQSQDNKTASLLVLADMFRLETEMVHFRQEGIELIGAIDVRHALDLARHYKFDAAVLDLSLPFVRDVETVKDLQKIDPNIPVIVFGDKPSSAYSENGLDKHVFDYLSRPIDMGGLLRTVRHAIEHRRLMLENRRLTQQLFEGENGGKRGRLVNGGRHHSSQTSVPALVGESKPMGEVCRLIEEVAPTEMTVLIVGESGTGKDIVARLIHQLSFRVNSGAFVKINCPAVPEQLLESELFGYEAGAFTGAHKRKPGRIELAANGFVFMDEIGEVPPTLQAKLLQVLEEKEFTRLGGNEIIGVDTRILAATNASLEREVGSGRFRADLYFRLSQFTIHLPPLRKRVEDIPLLVHHFLERYAPVYGHKGLAVSSETMAMLVEYAWPGNVRELESVVRRYALTGREESIRSLLQPQSEETHDVPAGGTYHQQEKKVILAALTSTKWNRRRAAEMLGISYNTLRRRITRFGLNCET